MLGILLYRLFLIAWSNFAPFEYFRQKNNFLKEKTLARDSSCCEIFYLAASEAFWGVRESQQRMWSRIAPKKHTPRCTSARTRTDTHAQSYAENCKVWSSPLYPPSHNKIKLNGTSPERLTFPRLSYFAYPKDILLLVARGSANWERQGSWHATA